MDLLPLLDELRIIAQNGAHYADNPYDQERYGRVLELVCEYYGEALELPPEQVQERFAAELGQITPKVGAEAGIFDEDDRILLMRRGDDGLWCLPAGWVEPKESPEETAIRETKEETGLEVRAIELVDVYHRPPAGRFGPHGEVAVVYLCERLSGTLTLSHEGEGLAYREIDEVSEWHKRHETYARDAQAAWADRG